MKYLGAITADEDLTTKEYVDTGDAAFPAKRAQMVRPNLLDNWYFVGGGSQRGGGQFPINQRGQTSYTNSANQYVYTIDRWMAQSGTVAVVSTGLQISFTTTSRQFIQRIEHSAALLGKTVTLSAKSAGRFGSVTITIPASPSTGTIGGKGIPLDSNIYAYLRYDGTRLYVSFYSVSAYVANTTATIEAVKLELGDTQTLAHQENGVWVLNEIPNYTKQLKRCQRFFIAFNHAGESYCKLGNGYAKSGTAAVMVLAHPTMRTTPSLTYSGSWAMKDYNNNYRSVSALSFGTTSSVGSSLNITSSSMTSGREYTLTANNDSTANIYLSADL